MKNLQAALGAVLFLAVAIGCVQLQPGSDPLVVRCEQAETNAAGTLNLVVTVDASAPAFFRTNAPAFHQFCERLRVPLVNIQGTNWPPGLAGIVSLDLVKQDYKASRAGSNAFYSAIATLESTLSQANGWLVQMTNNPH